MPTPPPRKRFQIHLSTAIVMMFVAGALIWANVSQRGGRGEVLQVIDQELLVVDYELYYGWPFPMVTSQGSALASLSEMYALPEWKWHAVSLTLNGVLAVAVVVFVAFLCERRIRRRAARKGA